jgi:preprotein translocase subunit SecE
MERKWTYLMFAAGGVVLAYLLVKIGDWGWSLYSTKPNQLLLNGAAFGVAALATIVAIRNERVFTLATEVTAELKKVTWPDRKETFSATVVVIITVIIASLFLGLFDGIWSYLTKFITP